MAAAAPAGAMTEELSACLNSGIMAHSFPSKMILAGGVMAIVLWTCDPLLFAATPGWQSSDRLPGPSVFVVGAVAHAGEYDFEPGMTVADALSAAGGLRDRSEPPPLIEIRRKTADGLEVKPAKLSDRLLANDTVAVSRSRKGRQPD